jgi:hypothetical protein
MKGNWSVNDIEHDLSFSLWFSLLCAQHSIVLYHKDAFKVPETGGPTCPTWWSQVLHTIYSCLSPTSTANHYCSTLLPVVLLSMVSVSQGQLQPKNC